MPLTVGCDRDSFLARGRHRLFSARRLSLPRPIAVDRVLRLNFAPDELHGETRRVNVRRRWLGALARPNAPSDKRPNRSATVFLALQAGLAICACAALLRGLRAAPQWVLAVDVSVLAAWPAALSIWCLSVIGGVGGAAGAGARGWPRSRCRC